MCDKPILYHSNNTGSKDQHKFIHKLIQCDDIHNRGGARSHSKNCVIFVKGTEGDSERTWSLRGQKQITCSSVWIAPQAQSRFSRGILLQRPVSIANLWDDSLNRVAQTLSRSDTLLTLLFTEAIIHHCQWCLQSNDNTQAFAILLRTLDIIKSRCPVSVHLKYLKRK